jgi:tryptophanyl-tRNA synthetase
LKVELGELVADYLQPIQERYHTIRNDEAELKAILKKGADTARESAQKTLRDVQEAIGFVLP